MLHMLHMQHIWLASSISLYDELNFFICMPHTKSINSVTRVKHSRSHT